ncbi:Alpha/Beta hydrolase protein, partial [Zopfochytrium polystomum]
HKDVIAPDHTDNKTVLALGQMAYNAYYEPEAPDWTPIPGWETSDGFGSSGDAIRGYVFSSPSYDVIAIVIKGTSLQTPFSGGPTSVNDKLNDNKMFSCCCGKVGWSWTPVCDCADNTATTCNVGCVERESDYKESYYRLATSIAHTVQQIFPRSAIWMTGHSLGGALASLVALTFDLPAFTYQTPGDLLFAKRLGLLPPTPPVPPPQNGSSQALGLDAWEPYLNTLPIYQFGNDGDPVFLGQCRSVTSSCWFGGYALETHCHVGKECVYDSDLDGKLPKPNQTSTDGRTALRKSLSINNHGIKYVIDRFLVPWEFAPDCRV